ncbi:hypothetical protein HJG54_07585 [Leptolyngbya sp. NK1-12]|uniref:Uncharacterized protein n=1 Tax=Leptolyngbya sp. NK1-12 TaxID=2547451 RepID=A0AA96WAD1_9CYAN|nr:hypothetical protein [Leptolyngbya sp. NK1-12]WNZ22732.1 hypothetical protein HJG54_07585 [Leptolyngbya sp. NK1-12]
MPRKFNRVRAASVLVEATLKSDKEVALAYGVSVRAIEYWRQRLKRDEELQQEYRRMAQVKLAQWVSQIPDSLELAIGFISSAARSGDVRDPKMVVAMSGAISVLSEVLVVQESIAARNESAS